MSGTSNYSNIKREFFIRWIFVSDEMVIGKERFWQLMETGFINSELFIDYVQFWMNSGSLDTFSNAKYSNK